MIEYIVHVNQMVEISPLSVGLGLGPGQTQAHPDLCCFGRKKTTQMGLATCPYKRVRHGSTKKLGRSSWYFRYINIYLIY